MEIILFQEKVFPKLLEAFGITDWELDLPNPEEKAEATKLSFIQQRAQIVTALAGLGFTMSLKEQDVDMLDAEFIISGNMVPSAEMAGEAQAMEVAQQEQQFQLQQMQMEQQAEGGGEQGGGMPMQPPASGPPGPPPEMRERPPRMPPNMRRGGRPDVGMARGVATFDDAINMEEK